MAKVNGEPGFTQYTKLNVTEELLKGGVPVATRTGSEFVLEGTSTAASQQPSALDTPLQVEFGPLQDTDELTLAADGAITIKEAGQYVFVFIVQVGRSGSGGTARLFGRVLSDGTQVGGTVYYAAINQNSNIPVAITLTGTIQVGRVITLEIVRASAVSGTNDGGLFEQDPSLTGWAPAASAKVTITKPGDIEEISVAAKVFTDI